MRGVLANGLVDLGGGRFERADLAVAAGRLTPSASGDVVDCSRFAVVPGMVNAHAHSNENWFRGLWDNLPLEPWMLFSYPVLAAPAQSADEIYVRTLLGGMEMLRSGATCVVDFLYDTEAALEPVVRAYRDLGLRALVAIGMGDRAYHETVVLDSRARLARPDRPARAREAADVGRMGGRDSTGGRAVPPPGRGHLDLPRAVRAAALHRRDARRLSRRSRRSST
jgi:cytosine/adenosine deaminase-related metal-dependent hydrolase